MIINIAIIAVAFIKNSYSQNHNCSQFLSEKNFCLQTTLEKLMVDSYV